MNGYNAIAGAKAKLGRWTEYLAMREGVLKLNETYRSLLSNDLGAVAAFLFDVGSGRYPLPEREGSASMLVWENDLKRVRKPAAAAKAASAAREADFTHTEVQGWLRDLGLALGYDVWIAANDGARDYAGGRLADQCLSQLPEKLLENSSADAIRLIDVIWLERTTAELAAAFEVEHTTSIYSGIVRMLDLALGIEESLGAQLLSSRPRRSRTGCALPVRAASVFASGQA